MRDKKMKRETARKMGEGGGGSTERQGILLYQASTDFANSYFHDCGKTDVTNYMCYH